MLTMQKIVLIYTENARDALEPIVVRAFDEMTRKWPGAAVQQVNPGDYNPNRHNGCHVAYISSKFKAIIKAHENRGQVVITEKSINESVVAPVPGFDLVAAGFSSGVISALDGAGIESKEDLAGTSKSALVDLPFIGPATAKKLLEWAIDGGDA